MQKTNYGNEQKNILNFFIFLLFTMSKKHFIALAKLFGDFEKVDRNFLNEFCSIAHGFNNNFDCSKFYNAVEKIREEKASKIAD